MGERTLFGYFHRMEAAKKAANELEEAGFRVDVSRVSPLEGGQAEGERDESLSNPMVSESMSLSEATLGSPPIFEDQPILRAVHPDASGMADGEVMDSVEDISVTVFPGERYDEAEAILKKHGARD